MRVVMCDILYQGTHCHFQDLASALNQSCMQLEPRFFFPLSSFSSCYCLSYSARRTRLTVFDIDALKCP
jgi:hypothetical protein